MFCLLLQYYVVVHRNTTKIIIKEVMEDPDIVGILVKRKDFFKYWTMFFFVFFITVGVKRKYESVRRSHKDKDGEIGEKYKTI